MRVRIPGFLETVMEGLGWEGSWVLVLRALVQFKQVLQECTSVLFKNIHFLKKKALRGKYNPIYILTNAFLNLELSRKVPPH